MQSPSPAIDPIPEPRARRIVEAAYALLDRDGLDALTIRAVLDATGLSRRAVYERFVSKDDLMLAVFQHTIRLGTAQFAGLVAPIVEPLDRLEAIVRGIVLGRGGDGRLGAAMSREHLRLSEQRPAELRAALAPLLGLLTDELARGTALGAVRAGDPAGMATMIYKLVSTTVHEELIAGGAPDDRATLAANLWDFCRRAIAA